MSHINVVFTGKYYKVISLWHRLLQNHCPNATYIDIIFCDDASTENLTLTFKLNLNFKFDQKVDFPPNSDDENVDDFADLDIALKMCADLDLFEIQYSNK